VSGGAVSRAIATQCAVLLKNDGGLLPLRAAELHTIAVIGPYAGAAHTGGGGSSAVKPLYTISPVSGIQRRVGNAVRVVYNDGVDKSGAAAAAKSADVVLLMVGNKDSEGKDRKTIALPGDQDALVEKVAGANPRTVVVLKSGGAVLMPWIDRVPSLLEAWYPGEEDGNVVADLLFGDANPSGKLPLTFPKSAEQVPAATPEQYPGVNLTATYSEKLQVGYRWYDANTVAPLFPFGFGLSYTSFEIKNLTVTPPAGADRPAGVAVDVTNAGQREGAEVVQVYVSAPASAGEPPKQLKGFAKVALKPGETRKVSITLDPRAFSIWDANANRWIVVSGQHKILAGNSSGNLPLQAQVAIP
jgi:beta-glucosidase